MGLQPLEHGQWVWKAFVGRHQAKNIKICIIISKTIGIHVGKVMPTMDETILD